MNHLFFSPGAAQMSRAIRPLCIQTHAHKNPPVKVILGIPNKMAMKRGCFFFFFFYGYTIECLLYLEEFKRRAVDLFLLGLKSCQWTKTCTNAQSIELNILYTE
jgi:hypothetical protein